MEKCDHHDVNTWNDYKADRKGTIRWINEKCNLCGAKRMKSGKRGSAWSDWKLPSNNGLHATDLFDELSEMSDEEYQNHLERKADGA